MLVPRPDAQFQSMRVVEKRRESRLITSFVLEPVEPDAWRPFAPGQFLTLRVPPAAGRDAVLRTYSASSDPAASGRYRITVKREGAPRAGLPDGVGSCFLHDAVAEGSLLDVAPPRGSFFLDAQSPRPVVLVSGGVGLTPMVSMLHALARSGTRRVYFLHACDDGDVHALREETDGLARRREGIEVRYCYRQPTADDRASQRFHAEGLLTAQRLRDWLPLDDYDVYLCGPPPFMTSVYGAFRGLGVAAHRIAYEFFGPASDLEAGFGVIPAPEATPAPAAGHVAQAGEEVLTVTFARSGIRSPWPADGTSLLDLAESVGLDPPFSCRAGVCSTCRTGLIAGEADYFEEPLEPPGEGAVLLCCARPVTAIVLDL